MVAERCSTRNSALRRAMAASHPGDSHQPSLAEEIKELELQVRQTEKMASIGQLAAGVALPLPLFSEKVTPFAPALTDVLELLVPRESVDCRHSRFGGR